MRNGMLQSCALSNRRLLKPHVRLLSAGKLRNQNAARLRTLRRRGAENENVNYRYRKDGETKEALWGESAKKTFFEEVDAQDHKASIASFFETLGGPPPAKAPSTMPPDAKIQSSRKTATSFGGSIFDAFPVPDAPPPVSPNAYDDDAYRQYRDMIDDVLNQERFWRRHTRKPLTEEFMGPIRSWLQADETKVEYNFPLLQSSVKDGVSSKLTDDESQALAASFRMELEDQREAFLNNNPWSEKQYEHAKLALIQLGSLCAKRARSLPLDVAWEKIKEAGMVIDKSALNNYLYSCTVYSGRQTPNLLAPSSGDSILDMLSATLRTTKLKSTEEKQNDKNEEYVVNVPEEVATFHDLIYEPTEQSVTIRVKALVAKGDAHGAEYLLDRFLPKQQEARLRTYLPILRCYLEQGDISSGLRLFKQMRDTPTVLLEAETYVQLISAIADHGFFSSDSNPIDGAEELGYSSACGPKLFDKLVSDMSEDVLEITSASARRLYSAFENAFEGQAMAKKLVKMHPLAPLSINHEPAEDGELIVSRVLVPTDSGVCPRSGAALRLINLEPEERKQTLDTLLKLAETTHQAWSGQVGTNDGSALVALREFSDWLDTREGEPFTAILDGANIAYYMQNFDQGKFNVYQIAFVQEALERMGENTLVVMPYKYCLPYFTTSGSRGGKQHMSDRERGILSRLSNEGKLYRVPKGCLDDYYWMLASISDQTVARGGRDIDVGADDPSGRWRGERPMLISNDQMRDHKFELLEPRLFRRWYSCHIVNFNFTAFVDDECVDREISFSPADFFSREIQGNPTRNSDGTDGGTAWHFPVSDWDTHERLCMRLPNTESN